MCPHASWIPEFTRESDILYKLLSITGVAVYLDEAKGRRAGAAAGAGAVASATPFASTLTAAAAGGTAPTAAPVVSLRSAGTVSHAYILAPANASARLTLCSKVRWRRRRHRRLPWRGAAGAEHWTGAWGGLAVACLPEFYLHAPVPRDVG